LPAAKSRKRKLPPVLLLNDVELCELPLLLTFRETSFQLRCGERHIYGLVEQGLLDLVKLGSKSSRITTASVLRLVRQRAEPSAHVPGLKQFADTEQLSDTEQFSDTKKEPQPLE
jgi:hypothetical protein